MNRIATSSGRLVPLDAQAAGQIDIEDIAWSLARICRFNGHIKRDIALYSVAQHSCLVSDLLAKTSERLAVLGLLHDAHEAYLGDIVTPVKDHLNVLDNGNFPVSRFASLIQHRIERALNIAPCEDSSWLVELHQADLCLLATEARDVMPAMPDDYWGNLPPPLDRKIVPWGYAEAARGFLRRAQQLGIMP